MNLYILFFVLVLYILFALKVSSKCIVSPFLVISVMFTISTGVTLCNLSNWNIHISNKTIITIIIGILSFSFGQIISNYFVIKKNNIDYCRNITITGKFVLKKPSFWSTVILALFQQIFMILFALFITKIGGGLNSSTIENARVALLLYSMPNFYGQIILISRVIGMVYIYLFIRKALFSEKNIKDIWYLANIVPYAIIEILSTSRSGFLYLVGYTVSVFTLMYQQKYGYTLKVKKRVIKSAMIGTLIFIFLFIGLGTLTGKTQKLGIVDMVSVYSAGSIPNLEYYIQNAEFFKIPQNYFYTLPIINSISSALGISKIDSRMLYYPNNMIPGALTPTNLYTCFTKIMIDYGFWGMSLFLLLVGFLYAYIYKRVVKFRYMGFLIVIYGYMMMPLFISSFEYGFGSFIFSPSGLYTFIYLFLIYIFCFKI